MRILSEIMKDWAQFTRDGRTLLLMLAAPALVIIILNAVFSGTSIELKKTALGLCDLDGSESSRLFISGIANHTELRDYTGVGGCSTALHNDVKGGKLAAAIIIPQGFEDGIIKGEAQDVLILLDNSRFQVSPSLKSLVGAAVQATGQEIGARFIMNVWAQLSDADSNLERLLSDANTTRAKALEMRADLKSTKESLSSLDISSVKRELQLANGTIDAVYSSLESAEGNLTKIEDDFRDYDVMLEQTEADLAAINVTLYNASAYIADAKGGADCSDPVFIAYCASLDALNSSVSSAHASIGDRLLKVRKAREGLHAANATIQGFKADIASARNGSAEAREKLASMGDFISELEHNRDSALSTLGQIDDSLGMIIGKTYELEGIIGESRGQIRSITGRAPESVVSPILMQPYGLLGEKSFFAFMLPSLLPLVLMFVALFISSTSLVREKYQGTFNRILLAQVHPVELAANKVLSYTVVMLPAALFLLALASIAFGAFPMDDAGLLVYLMQALALTLLVFCALGVLIALYCDSEATAFLTSLVIGLPLLFMSGLLFPFEFMPSLAAEVGIASPLTQGMLAMQSAVTYGSPSDFHLHALALYGVIITLAAAAKSAMHSGQGK